MATLTIRNLNENTKSIIRQRAARNGHSMEEEARRILDQAVLETSSTGLGTRINNLFKDFDDVPFELPEREPIDFDRIENLFGDVE